MPTRLESTEEVVKSIEAHTERLGNHLVNLFQFVALFVIGATIVWSATTSYWAMILKNVASVDDILLLFIYLELGAMVGIYFKTNRLPVQFLIYVAITVMTRSLASSLNVTDMPELRLLSITGATLMLALAVLVLRYAAHRFPPFVSHVESDYPTTAPAATTRSDGG